MTKSVDSKPQSASQQGNSHQPSAIVIKKYPNRRLYNTESSAYIVLDDVIDLIKSGSDFIIQDKKTGEDITRSILNQIIFEQEAKPKDFHFPLEVQKQLISMYGEAYGAVIPDYLNESLKLFNEQQANMSEVAGATVDHGTTTLMELGQNMVQQNLELCKRSWEIFGTMAGMPGSSPAFQSEPLGSSKDQSLDGEELDEIQSEIDALRDRLQSLK